MDYHCVSMGIKGLLPFAKILSGDDTCNAVMIDMLEDITFA